jgi:glycosyltransferase involved in cell wall biosynthesis
MTFIFDCRFIRVDHHDGISRFSSELFAAVSKKTKVIALICSVDQLVALPQGTDYLLANDPKNPLAELFLPRRLNKQDASVVFSPMQTMGSLGKKYKLVLTLHDLIYYKHRTPPASLGWPIRLAWWLFHMSFTPVRILLNRADAVVTISQTTKALIEANRLTRKPIHVIMNSASMTVADSAKTQPRSRNLLYMGSFMKYKNVETLVLAMNFLPEYTLTLCSKIQPGRKSQLLKMASESTSSRINFMNGVSESDYLNLLDESFALVSASKDEGFGIPVIEAMSRAVPVVVSEIPIFREITAGKGEFFDPESPDSFAQAIRRLEPIDSWQHASQKSLDQSKLFSWEESAEKLLRVVESLRG